jgi:hypothetical protein
MKTGLEVEAEAVLSEDEISARLGRLIDPPLQDLLATGCPSVAA